MRGGARIAGLCALIAALASCGDDGPAADAAPDDAAPRAGADDTDARPRPDAAAPDAAPPDAAGPDADPALLPDLVPEGITRDGSYYRVELCNRGPGSAAGVFRVRLASLGTGETFETAAVYAVPDPDGCAQTGGITCGLIGDPACDSTGTVITFVDPDDAVAETDELNNTLGVTF